MKLILDKQLKNDSYQLGRLDDNLVLLSKNAFFPWFILVPNTRETEYHKLDPAHQTQIQQHINAIARFIEENLIVDKINIASIGNVVSQCHIHIVGRRRSDPCWPGVVWGCQQSRTYEEDAVAAISRQLKENLPSFIAKQ